MKINYKTLILFCLFTMLNVLISKIFIALGIGISVGALLSMGFIIIFFIMNSRISIRKNYAPYIHRLYILCAIILLFYLMKVPIGGLNFYPRMVTLIKFAIIPFLIFIPFRLRLEEKQTEKIIKNILVFSCAFSILGILQFFFKSKLPDFLVEFSLYKSRSDNYMINNIEYFRTNGMIGNPLEYSFFLLIIQSISLPRFLNGNKFSILPYSLAVIATTTTLSRFGFIGIIIIFFSVFVFYRKFGKLLKISIITFAILSIVIFKFSNEISFYSNISERLLSKTKDSKTSNDTRYNYYKETGKFITIFPYSLVGYELGLISSKSGNNKFIAEKIHDGFWLAALMEQGIPFFIYYIFFWLYYLFLNIKNLNHNNYLSITTILIIGLFMLGSFVNSAYLNIINCSFIFIIGGLSLQRNYSMQLNINSKN